MRKFTPQELTQEEVVTLLKAALMSPTSKRTNCWQFIVVDDKEILEKLSYCKEAVARKIYGKRHSIKRIRTRSIGSATTATGSINHRHRT